MHLTPRALLYALACIVLPAAWGLIVVWASTALERRFRSRRDEDVPPIEYHI